MTTEPQTAVDVAISPLEAALGETTDPDEQRALFDRLMVLHHVDEAGKREAQQR